MSLGAQHDVEHPPFHPGVVLGDRDVRHRLHHLVEHLPPQLGVRHLAPLEAHRDLRLVTFLEKASHVLQLEVEVVLLGLGPHLDFLHENRRLLLARFLLAPGLRVLVLAEIHDAADRRIRLGRHLDEVEVAGAGGLQRFLDRHDAELLALGADDAYLANTDAFVDADVGPSLLTDRRYSSGNEGEGDRGARRPAGHAGDRGAPRLRRGATSDGGMGAMSGPPCKSIHERPTVRVADRDVISAARSASTRSTGTAPRSSPLRWRRLTVPLCRSRSPTTSMYGTLRTCASRMR